MVSIFVIALFSLMHEHHVGASSGQGVDGLIDWGRVMHICITKLTIIVSDNGLSPDQRQAII